MSRVKMTLLIGFLFQVSLVFANDFDSDLDLSTDLNGVLYARFTESYQSLLTVVRSFTEVKVTTQRLKNIMPEIIQLFKSHDTPLVLYAHSLDQNLSLHDITYSETYSELEDDTDEYLEIMEEFYGVVIPSIYKRLSKLSKNLSFHLYSKIQIIDGIWDNPSVRFKIIESFKSQPTQLKALEDLLVYYKKISDLEVFELQRSSIVDLLGDDFLSDLESDEEILIRLLKVIKTVDDILDKSHL
jgi:hypothetical protein